MRRLVWVLWVAAAAPLAGQQATPAQAALRRQVIERFVTNYVAQSGLTDEQTDRFREVIERSFRERRAIETRQRRLTQALEGQLRPGVAANEDSVVALLGELTRSRQDLVDLANRDLETFASFLDPIQQAQLILSLERFQRQIDNLIRRRAQQIRR